VKKTTTEARPVRTDRISNGARKKVYPEKAPTGLSSLPDPEKATKELSSGGGEKKKEEVVEFGRNQGQTLTID